LQATANLLRKDERVFFMFISPSGNGLKVIFKIKITNDDTIQEQHFQAFKAIENYFATEYVIYIDASGKDVSRLCFLCHDSNAYINTNCTYFDYQNFKPIVNSTATTNTPQQTKQQAKYTSFTTSQASEFSKHENSIEAVERFTNNKLQLNKHSPEVIYEALKRCETFASNRDALDEPVNNNYIFY